MVLDVFDEFLPLLLLVRMNWLGFLLQRCFRVIDSYPTLARATLVNLSHWSNLDQFLRSWYFNAVNLLRPYLIRVCLNFYLLVLYLLLVWWPVHDDNIDRCRLARGDDLLKTLDWIEPCCVLGICVHLTWDMKNNVGWFRLLKVGHANCACRVLEGFVKCRRLDGLLEHLDLFIKILWRRTLHQLPQELRVLAYWVHLFVELGDYSYYFTVRQEAQNHLENYFVLRLQKVEEAQDLLRDDV